MGQLVEGGPDIVLPPTDIPIQCLLCRSPYQPRATILSNPAALYGPVPLFKLLKPPLGGLSASQSLERGSMGVSL